MHRTDTGMADFFSMFELLFLEGWFLDEDILRKGGLQAIWRVGSGQAQGEDGHAACEMLPLTERAGLFRFPSVSPPIT